jgi:hypothetical protein
VTQRRCGTCAHFIADDATAIGQCGHPERRALLGLVVVRAHELACRRGLNDDYWEAAVAIRSSEDEAARRPTPATNDRATQPAPAPQPSAPRAGANGEPADPPPTAGPTADAQAGAASVRRRTGYQGAPPTVQIGGVDRADRRELNTDGIPIPKRRGAVAEVHSRARIRNRAMHEPGGAPEAVAPPRSAATEAPAAAEGVPAAPSSRPAKAPPVVAATAATVAVAATATRVAARPAGPPPAESGATTNGKGPHPGDLPPSRTTITAQADRPSPAEPRPRPPGAGASARPAPPAHWSVAASAEPPPAASTALGAALQEWREEWRAEHLAEHPERRCATCRDFRAAEGAGRGWCVNPHAFPTRQLVEGGDLACLTGLGAWWVRSDQFWLSKAGAEPTQPTPLADGLIFLINEARSGRRRS